MKSGVQPNHGPPELLTSFLLKMLILILVMIKAKCKAASNTQLPSPIIYESSIRSLFLGCVFLYYHSHFTCSVPYVTWHVTSNCSVCEDENNYWRISLVELHISSHLLPQPSASTQANARLTGFGHVRPLSYLMFPSLSAIHIAMCIGKRYMKEKNE